MAGTEPQEAERARLLDAAEDAFYARGFQAVGMDAIRSAARLPLKRIYSLYGSKEDLIVAVLERRDAAWRGRLNSAAESARSRGRDPLLAVFDWLQEWFDEPGFRGCAWINAFGELGGISPRVTRAVRAHKEAFRDDIRRMAAETGHGEPVADQIYLLAEGAITAAGIMGTSAPARTAASAARPLLDRALAARCR